MRTSLRLAVLVAAAVGCAGCASTTATSTQTSSSTTAPTHEDGTPPESKFTPAFNISGKWIADGDFQHPSIYTQHGKLVTDIYDNGRFHHTQSGRFFDPHILVTIQTRVNIATQATTRMSLTYIFDSPDHADVYWVALDSNADLTRGQTGVAHIDRAAQ